jgi:membrane associated rhomboid family serine protease
MFQGGQIAAPLILILTVGISLLGLYRLPHIIDVCLFRPFHLIPKKQFDTVILSGFVHADLNHLLLNMITFFFFAFPLERMIGTIPFLGLYFFGLLVSHACTWYKHRAEPRYASLGASGAISAVLFAFVVYNPMMTIYIMGILPITAYLFAFIFVAYSYWAGAQNADRINHDAHLCGAISGLIFVAFNDADAYASLMNSF